MPVKVKIIVPNTTAGLIIGKGGVTIRHIMESTGAKVQLSQKPEQINLQVRLQIIFTLSIGHLSYLSYFIFFDNVKPLTQFYVALVLL